MEFLLLGPLKALCDGEAVALGSRRAQRCLLGILLLEPNQVIAIERLADLLWDGDPPDSYRSALRTHVSRLRKLLGSSIELSSHSAGYAAEIDPCRVDVHRFSALADEANGQSDPAQRAAFAQQALELWRGPLLAAEASDQLRDRLAPSLDELRLTTWETYSEAQLDTGNHRQIITKLTGLVAANPLRERLTRSLMLALYRDGRQADALDAYQATRKALAEQTGLDVSGELAKLHESMLRTELAVTEQPGKGGKRAPRQLPPGTAHFVGRMAELDAIITAAREPRSAPLLVAINGQGGSGKSVLAINAAHQLAAHYPDGQLYLDLQGSTPGLSPLEPRDALARLLRTLGIDNQRIPYDAAEAATMLRDQTAGRRMLLVLDNARDAAQVRPLLPAEPACFTIVTSRAILSTLDNARHHSLDLLAEDEAMLLLANITGRNLGGEDDALQIVRCCGLLPLALRIAAARLAARPSWSLASFANLLASARTRLDELHEADLNLRASITISREALDTGRAGPHAAKLLERIGLLDCPDITAPVAASLTELPLHETQAALDRLTQEHILSVRTPGRYSSHDLIRLYAREQAQRETNGTPHPAFLRILNDYTATTAAVWRSVVPNAMLCPPYDQDDQLVVFRCTQDASAWLSAEIDNITPVARQAVSSPDPAPLHMTRLAATTLFPLSDYLCRNVEYCELQRLAIPVLREHGDLRAEASARAGLALGLVNLLQNDAALTEASVAGSLARRVGDLQAEAQTLLATSGVYWRLRDFQQAEAPLRRAIRLVRHAGLPAAEANYLDNLGRILQHLGRFDEAIRCHESSLQIRRDRRSQLGVAAATSSIGWALGTFGPAQPCHRSPPRGP